MARGTPGTFFIAVAIAQFPYAALAADKPGAQSGLASVYAYSSRATASGEKMQPAALTAAHRSLPFGTRVTVTHRSNGRSVTVRINDRGPFIKGRIIDLSPSAAAALGFRGLAPVTVKVARGG